MDRDEVCRFLEVQNANATLPQKYAAMMQNFNKLTPDEYDELTDEIIEQIEQEELRLKKQEVMFNVIENDQAYYQSLISTTDE